MPAVVGCEIVACGIGIVIVDPLSLIALCYRGLSLLGATVVVMAVSKPSVGDAEVNISGVGGSYAHRNATEFSLAFIRLGSNVCWALIISSS